MLGTLGFVVAMPVIVVPPPGIESLAPWQAILVIVAKVALGMLILLKGLDLFKIASFPPGSVALDDPIARWFADKQAALRKRSWFLYMLMDFVLLLMPVLMGLFLLAVALRPVYVTLQQRPPTWDFFYVEANKTVHFLMATVKGLFFLTLSSMMGCGAALLTLAYLMFQVHR